jgi:hypothetical protein
VIIYQKELPPNMINIVGNQILDPFSCGVYVAAGRNITINGNRISGQIDSNDAIEPKAAICLNQMDNGHDGRPATILGNTITGSRIGIAIAEGTVPNVRQNSISQIPSDGIGTPSSLAIVDLFLTGTAYPTRWYRDPSGAQPVCNFSDVGSFRGVFQRTAAAQTFTAQTRFSMGCK